MKINYFTGAILLLASAFLTDCDGEYSSSVYEEVFNVPPADVSDLAQNISSTGQVSLSWTLPEDYDVVKVRVSSAIQGQEAYLVEDMTKRESYTIYGLDTGNNYEFTVQTINKKGTLSSGVSISYTPNINTDLISYKCDYTALDFGYTASSSEKTFIYTSEEDSDISLSDISISYVEGSQNVFSFVESDVSVLKPGESASITVKYEPSSASSWDEADLVISTDPAVSIRLTGSGYKQPSDVQGDHLNLWLRADLVSSSDFDSYGKVVRMPDYSGNGYDAVAFNSDVPSYKTLSTMNDQPALYFTNYERLTAQGKIATNSETGTTTFIVFQKGTTVSSSFFFSASNGYSNSFPSFGTYSRNYDTSVGWASSAKYVHMISGNGYAGSYRFYFDDSEDDDNEVKVASSATAYTICAVADFQSESVSNTYAYLNGKKSLLSFTGSLNTSNLSNTSLGYAYGKPWSNGEGQLYQALWNSELSTESERESYYKCHPSEHPTRPNDSAIRWWCLQDYETYGDNYEYGANTISTNYSSYFYNKLTTTSGICDTISNVFLGTRIDTDTTPGYTYIACVMIYDTVLTEEEIAEVNNFIYYRYGVGSYTELDSSSSGE
ncbi:fibronectin type III domain-containing protein [Treponema sp.]|uniref:fibronectin type III domain-containing protein n=1 Tax=Treponema sp. TaxID=166 RepID=UPI0025DA82CC|nr:fibronectin type III domain-containing protein [Treponema sp.]MCR5217998.1 fibronectin type III domain-containing protein [Treponema sp.]